MGTELAKAYVQIVPTAKGIKGNLTEMLGGEAEKAGSEGGKKFASKFGSAMGAVGKVAAAGLAAAATGVAAIGKQAVQAYADFEQLEGGIETLFGSGGMGLAQYAKSVGKPISEIEDQWFSMQDAQEIVMKNAANAFKTAGMSANDYMETAIQSGAAMIASLGGDTEKAASLMDMSITDMADNVNKMGTSMEAVQNAYRGFSRGNFTMLDNLALGFAGTKEGMQQLLDKAAELSGVKYDIGSYADIVQAIHVVQDEMGITGTTATEAAGTISGSISSLQAAWQNLLAGLANSNANQGQLIANLVSSVKNVAANLLPVIRQVLQQLGPLIQELAPIISAELPPLLQDVLPGLIEAAISLALALGQALADNAPGIISSLCDAIVQNAPALIEGAIQLIAALVSGLGQAAPTLITSAIKLVGIILKGIWDGIPQLLQAGAELVAGLWNGIAGAAGWLWGKITEWLSSIWDGIKEFFGVASPSKEMAWMGEMLSEGLANGITDSAADAVDAATQMSANVLSAMSSDSAELGLTASGAGTVEIRHTGSIRVEGVNSQGELIAVTDILYDQIVARLRQEVRYA